MSQIYYEIGDASRPIGPPPIIIAHVCNDQGGWGKGFVLALSRRWSEPASRYRAWHAGMLRKDFGLGQVQFVPVMDRLFVANMVAQKGYRSEEHPRPLQYGALEKCLRTVAERAVKLGATVHMPRIGIGFGGGSWDVIEPMIESTIIGAGVWVVVYDLPKTRR